MGIKIIAKNKRAKYDYQLLEKFEAGMQLRGTEVKSLRLGKVNLAESHISLDQKGEAWIHNMSIPAYEFGNINNHPERRKRKLLLNKKELDHLVHSMKARGLTIVPTIVYFKQSLVKLEIYLAKGKKLYDKRQDEAAKDFKKKINQGHFD